MSSRVEAIVAIGVAGFVGAWLLLAPASKRLMEARAQASQFTPPPVQLLRLVDR